MALKHCTAASSNTSKLSKHAACGEFCLQYNSVVCWRWMAVRNPRVLYLSVQLFLWFSTWLLSRRPRALWLEVKKCARGSRRIATPGLLIIAHEHWTCKCSCRMDEERRTPRSAAAHDVTNDRTVLWKTILHCWGESGMSTTWHTTETPTAFLLQPNVVERGDVLENQC